MAANEDEDPSYVDYEAFLDPSFSPSSFANSLVLATNNPNDTPLDLSTPLSKVLFDAQEIDSHIDLLTTRSAIPLLSHATEQTEASGRIIAEIDNQVKSLNESYKQLEKEVIQKHAEADEVRQVAARLWETLKLGRSVGRCLQLGRQLEIQHTEISSSGAGSRKEDHRALVRCAHTLISLREILDKKAPGEEGYGLDKVNAIRSLQDSIIGPIEKSVKSTSEQIVREFNVGSASGTTTFAQSEEAKARIISAAVTLYFISPITGTKPDKWTPQLLLQALEVYLRNSLQSSIASLARSLATLPSLDRTLAEISARCQNIVALEIILSTTNAPPHPLLPTQKHTSDKSNLLQYLLAYLETGSLASYFWRTMASSLATRVQEIVNRGGVSARTLKTNRNTVGEAIRECVIRGSQPPNTITTTKGKSSKGGPEKSGEWDREVAVMVGSVVGNLGR
ncbi:oligomeric Golgi complex subunit 5 [Annulohypoxylon maeteangense]|uniref:oligomeric Golgi complex subunit 5 n=1 Tax=Annulohypoxylon maeteangense TaxID=1927788 RepID=UPI0020083F92|nr:oligomeric Golgi complex subunit 5 [Annulohypoxylon maeteangense]KAI0886686.1 oligomeric Golgi complex subunit 5 [Annulohypoxylon maeteangense]